MKITIPTENLSQKSYKSKSRKSGHYWVKWSGCFGDTEVWRIAVYYENAGGWYVTGDKRLYFDNDFCKIDERRIPMNSVNGIWATLVYAFCIIAIAIQIYYTIKIITK